MGAVLVPVIAVLVVIVAGALAVRRFGRNEREHSDRLQADDRATVRYQVPPGQDPAAVLAQLRQAGYDASADSEPGPSSPILIIGSRSAAEPDRERLRVILANASVNVDPSLDSESEQTPGTVRFVDE